MSVTSKNISRIGIIVAMDKEMAQLKKVFSDNPNIILHKCGVGKVNSAIGATLMIEEYQPDLIISTGCAGGADTALQVGQVVVAAQCAYHDVYCGTNYAYGQFPGDPQFFDTPQWLVDKALKLNERGDVPTVKSGLPVSGDWFVDSKEKMYEILKHYPEAAAVDMESCSIAHACWLQGIPFVSFRIISDVPLKDHKAEMYFNFWDKMAEGSFDVTRAFVDSLLNK